MAESKGVQTPHLKITQKVINEFLQTNSTSENSQQSSSAAQSEDSKSPPSRKFSPEPLTEPDVAQDLEKVNYIANEIENQIKNLKQVYESMKHKLSKNRRVSKI